jgi:putative transcriptional regulator
MKADDLYEALLEPLAPSAGRQRDEALARAGAADHEIRAAKEVIAALGASPTTVTASGVLRNRLVASMARRGRYGRYADRLARLFDVSIEAGEALCASIEDEAAFQPFFTQGVDLIHVPAGPRFAGCLAAIARIQAGVLFPHHKHIGDETMVVLAGGFREEGPSGKEVWSGEELICRGGSSHAFVALEGQACIAASLIEGSVEFI